MLNQHCPFSCATAGAAAAQPVALLNAPVLTAMGCFCMAPICLQGARELVASRGFVSAIGHASTAAVLSELLGIDCRHSRIDFQQAAGQTALVLRLAKRLPEGQVLCSRAEVEAWGYSLVLLSRLPAAKAQISKTP